MATVTQTTREVALLVEREPRSVWVFKALREVGTLNDVSTPISNRKLREVAQLNDNYQTYSWSRLREVGQLNDRATQRVRRPFTQRETALLSGRAVGGVRVTATLRDVARLYDDVLLSNPSGVLRDVARLNDVPRPKVYARRTLRETAKFKSRTVVPVGAVVREVAQLNDVSRPRIYSRPLVREVAQLDSRLAGSVRNRNSLREVARFKSRASSRLTTRGVLHEVGYVADTAVPPSYGRAYTCSIVTWGMSTLSNFHFRTMAGKYGAGENLWRLDADDDYGTPISSHITTGIKDFGADQMKRLSAVYVAGSADEPVTVDVIADVNGVKQTFSYPLDLRDQTNYRNNRALVGKGFRSRFAQFKIGATAVKYKLLSADADVAVTARRL